MPGRAPAPLSETLGPALARLRRRMEERDAALLRAWPSCPGPCDDGRLSLPGPEGEASGLRVPCPHMGPQCHHGRELRLGQCRALASALEKALPPVHVRHFLAPEPTMALKFVRSWIPRQSEVPFLLLLGEKGVGKSFAAAYACYLTCGLSLPPEGWRSPGTWRSRSEDAASRLCWMHAYSALTDRDSLRAAAAAPFLVLDDTGSEEGTAQACARMNYLVSARYDSQLPMIVTGNISLDDFSLRYGSRAADRLLECGSAYCCRGANLRLGGTAGEAPPSADAAG